jgi:hypothetical protein
VFKFRPHGFTEGERIPVHIEYETERPQSLTGRSGEEKTHLPPSVFELRIDRSQTAFILNVSSDHAV